MLRLPIRRRIQLATMTAVCALAGAAAAQDMPSAASPPQAVAPAQQASAPQATAPQPAAPAQQASAPQATAPQPGPATPAANPLNQGQLEQIVAPIALYPDPLLSQVLMASTYPLEVVEAERWTRDPAHGSLKGDALTQALKDENWDPSVKALAPFPRLLALMAQKLDWTQSLGNAFLAQQADVMNAVQSLRHDAMAAGTLKATPQCHCVIQTSGDIISILPSDSALVCIPIYNPKVAYGAWPEPEYPPYFFPVPAGFAFDPGIAIGFWPVVELADFGPFWGWGSIDWGGHDISVDRSRYEAVDPHPAFAGGTWAHDPAHRGGVAYSDPAVTARFGTARVAAVAAAGRTALLRGPTAGEHLSETRAAASAGRFGGRAAETAGHFGGGGHVAHANFAPGRMGGAGPHSGGGGHGGGHVAHANFAPARMGGGGHGGGGHGGGHGGGGGHHR